MAATLTAEQLRSLCDRLDAIVRSTSRSQPCHPRLVGIRDDTSPRDVVREW